MSNERAYELALQQVARGADGSISEDKLIAAIVANLDFDVDEAKRGKAKRIVADKKRSGRTHTDGQLVLPLLGLDPYAYEPSRLVTDDDGNVIENAKSRPNHKKAEADRAKTQAGKAAARALRRAAEADLYTEWAYAQLAAGRPDHEVAWDTCIREMHMWKEADPEEEVDEEPEGDDEST